jgi:glycosyltransferase involved in cell wall biosynthesis
MKVAFLARELREAGTTTHMLTLAQYLIKNGHEVSMLAYWDKRKNNELIYKFRDSNVQLFFAPFPNDQEIEKAGIYIKVIQLLKIIISFFFGIIFLFKFRPDVIHVHFPITSYIASVYRSITGTPIVTTHHIGNMKPRPLYKRADEVIAVGSEIGETAVNVFKYPKQKVHVIPNGISKDIFEISTTKHEKMLLRQSLKLPEDKKLVLFVGSIESRKGIDILLKACSTLRDEGEIRNLNIVILGNGDEQWLNKFIDKYKVRDEVIRRPFQDPLPFYRAADIFVLPSRVEGFGLVCIEAMMTGLVTVRSDSEGAYDQIDDKKNGFLFPNGNTEELSKILKQLLTNETICRQIGEMGKKRALNLFTSEVMYKKTLDVYKKSIRKNLLI